MADGRFTHLTTTRVFLESLKQSFTVKQSQFSSATNKSSRRLKAQLQFTSETGHIQSQIDNESGGPEGALIKLYPTTEKNVNTKRE